MRVNEQSLTDQVSSTASRAAESQRIQVDTGASSGGSGAAAGDRVDLSGLAGRISQTMQALASQSAQRVSQLQKDFRAGRYQPDAQQIAGALARS
jgi:anti-sigma28 factor (negative regulator of flagellin synthesis)